MIEAYGGLFWAAFIAATLIPAASEVLLLSFFSQGFNPWGLWFFATLGNVLGALVNYALGRYLLHYQDRRWFPFAAKNLERHQAWFNRYGVWVLLLAWLPLVGDALTFLAGVMRVRLSVFVVLVTLGKGGRYAFLLGVGTLL